MPQIWRRLPFQLRGVVVQPVRRSLKKKATGRLAYLKEAAISQSDAFLSTTRRIFWFIVVIADYAISFFLVPRMSVRLDETEEASPFVLS